MRLGCIYRISNKVNGKVYIGQTLQNPFKRMREHFKDSYTGRSLLHDDIRLYGITAFIFEVLEDNIPDDLLDEKEIYYIKSNNSYHLDGGYNLTRGGQDRKNVKLSEEDVRDIIRLISEGRNFRELSFDFGVDYGTISDINCGDTWNFSDVVYPVRAQHNKKKNFSNSDIRDMYALLRSGNTLSYIASKYDTSIQTIRRINLGEIYHCDDEVYPIIKMARGNVSSDVLTSIVYDLEMTDLTFNDIARKYNVDRHTVSKINSGERYVKELEKIGIIYFPIR